MAADGVTPTEIIVDELKSDAHVAELVDPDRIYSGPPEKTIPLAEIFGPTIQGEGALAGRPTYFLRIGGCDYKCDWCDTAHAVNPEEVRKLERKTQAQILGALVDWCDNHLGPSWLTISGGNPAMYDLSEIVYDWQSGRGGKVTVETQGSRWQNWLARVDQLTISPKPPSSGLDRGNSLDNLMRFIDRLRTKIFLGSLSLKVICFDEADYDFASEVHRRYRHIPFYLSVGTAMGGLSGRWVPPPIPGIRNEPVALSEGDFQPFDYFYETRLDGQPPLDGFAEPQWHLLRRYRWLVEKAAADPVMSDVAIFPQLHALIWGIDTKGV